MMWHMCLSQNQVNNENKIEHESKRITLINDDYSKCMTVKSRPTILAFILILSKIPAQNKNNNNNRTTELAGHEP